VDPKNPFPKRPDNPHPSEASDPDFNSTIDEFFARLQADTRRPPPSAEAVSAARQAMRQLAAESVADAGLALPESDANSVCAACGHRNRPGNLYCAACGVALPSALAGGTPRSQERAEVFPGAPSPSMPEGQHHYHHHYHHHYFAAGAEVAAPASRTVSDSATGRVRAPGNQVMSRVETAVRKVMQDWAFACNNRRLDDLVSTYTADALVLRPNHPAVRGAAAIREFFFVALDAGLGDVELDPLRLDVLGDVAYEAGRCKMLVPVAVNKRREERGKYLSVLSRKSNGEWAIACDCWSSDLNIASAADAEPATAATPAPPLPKPQTPRK
jgi:ketosteroid isomerase-like protein